MSRDPHPDTRPTRGRLGLVSTPPYLVVGIDGSFGSLSVARWAATWAAARSLQVRLLTGCAAEPRTASARTTMIETVGRMLGRVAATLRRDHAGLAVTPHVVTAAPATALIEASRGAAAVVVGLEPGPDEGSGKSAICTAAGCSCPLVHRGQLAEDLATHAHSVVIAVPTGQVWAAAPIIVGVDGSPGSLQATRFAITQAAASGVALVGLSVHGPRPDQEQRNQRHHCLRAVEIDALLEPLARSGPEVSFTTRHVYGDPVRLLACPDRDASLVVVGFRGCGRRDGPWLGSVTRGALRQASVPVAVIRPRSGGRGGRRPHPRRTTTGSGRRLSLR